MPRYEFKEGSSSKFWEITVEGKKVTTRWGRIGTAGQSKTKSFASPAAAQKEYDKLLGEKTRKGYTLVGGAKAGKAAPAAPAVKAARNLELEARLVESPDEVDSYLVYADWLQTQGDPRGELITLQHARKKKHADDLLARHVDHFLGPLQPYAKALDESGDPSFEWELGFIRGARLSYDSNSVEDLEGGDELSLEKALTLLLKHPSGALLRDLLVPINMRGDGCYFEPLCKVIAKHGAPALRSLRLGEFHYAGPRGPKGTDYDYEISWTQLGDMSGMWKSLPRLETLELMGSMGNYQGKAKLGAIKLPALRRLEIRTGGMDRANTRAIAAADWPSLEYLDLWFGRSHYGFSGGVADLEPILDGTRLPRLKHLGLMNAEFTDELCQRLASAKILPRLEELSLALGTMTDAGAETLVASARAFSHLKLVDLEYNFLSKKGEGLIRKLAKKVLTGNQKEPWDWTEENGGRYASVGE
jgi:uncharacterized protein (TIGR02996 family)